MDWWRALIQSQSFFLISAIVCCQSQHVIQKYASNMHTKITFPCTSEPIALWTESVCLINGVTAQCAGGFWEGCQSAVSPIAVNKHLFLWETYISAPCLTRLHSFVHSLFNVHVNWFIMIIGNKCDRQVLCLTAHNTHASLWICSSRKPYMFLMIHIYPWILIF